MARPRVDIGSIRRMEIVEAAVEVIARKGLQRLSLSEIEKKAQMSRGQLTYYFPSKESILLAVFDRLLELMHEEIPVGGRRRSGEKARISGWERVSAVICHVLEKRRGDDTFHALEFTFLSQITHREDFRKRLSGLYENWRGQLAEDLSGKAKGAVNARDFATLIQAILHGLNVQRAADPEAFDPVRMATLVLDVISSYLSGGKLSKPRKKAKLVLGGKT